MGYTKEARLPEPIFPKATVAANDRRAVGLRITSAARC